MGPFYNKNSDVISLVLLINLKKKLNLHTYKTTQTSNMRFIKNSIFENNRDPCPPHLLLEVGWGAGGYPGWLYSSMVGRNGKC